ncbi:hypothetical protein LCI18_015309 [Fusarium solani-melongenae]|uniref:Uncharacterized protein n=1 Tax=Fusarium solani subsp. cucurbitae TaxID=2747967 RepID=A0ACD3ZSW3_FUSSC|nr:hypothetical protein LCI18_015309 [Fusarium solani-melongenae]
MDVSSGSDDAIEFAESGAGLENDGRADTSIGSNSQLENMPASPSSTISETPDTKDRHGSSTSSGSQAIGAPAVRRMLKQNNLNVDDVQGTGKDGRILKEDVLRHMEARTNLSHKGPQPTEAATVSVKVEDHVGNPDSGQQPELVIKGTHNFGIAVDTPNGLLVPVVHNVQSHSVISLAAEISRLGKLARGGGLTIDDMKGGTLVVSNIGSIGGNVVAPVITSPMTAIVAVGQTEDVPTFETDQDGNETIVKKKQAVLSWSADHRVIDGATVARCAQQVAMWLEKPETMGVALR